MAIETRKGACQCGAVRFETVGAPKFIANCHCRSCRRATGAAYSTWVGFLTDHAEWTREAPAIFASSPGVERGYCKACGTPLAYASTQWPGEIHFLVGAFSDPDSLAPRTEAFAEEALSWAPRLKGPSHE